MKNAYIIEVAENCQQRATHPGESSDFRRGVREVIRELERASREESPTTADALESIADRIAR